ncbi:hypothetical protein A1O1_03958 [Capronia coronata CBS 617.96]|uniref:Stc1 domain-containing protein n=1 Tax=Capronia coronata CBS 617.96 TaxID=1182541 RepID=W9YEC5_9EURO|nr:uncharacterized protein A1O1_03958 [Capronia coronata CBS 617.96]EXJ90853.1 hypothetical protein A1O1_03958 [Capronia coronata CBS 617.96]
MPSLASATVKPTNEDGRYDNVDIGTMVKCGVCNVNRFVGRYSNNQRQRYQEAVFREQHGGPRAPRPTCLQCTPGNVQEMKCTGCGIIKTLDAFSKAQRKKPDHAKCIGCQQEILDRVPNLADAVEEEVIREEYTTRRAEAFAGMSNMGSTLPSVSGSASQAPSTTASGGILLAGSAQPWGANPAPALLSATGSISDTEESVVARTAPRAASTYSSNNYARGGFARQGAYRAPTEARVLNQIHREEMQQQQFQAGSRREDSDDESDFEY